MAIGEGVEKMLAVHAVTGLGTWASGGAGRLPGLANLVPSFIECVTVIVDDNDAGRKHSSELADRLADRGLEVLMREATP